MHELFAWPGAATLRRNIDAFAAEVEQRVFTLQSATDTKAKVMSDWGALTHSLALLSTLQQQIKAAEAAAVAIQVGDPAQAAHAAAVIDDVRERYPTAVAAAAEKRVAVAAAQLAKMKKKAEPDSKLLEVKEHSIFVAKQLATKMAHDNDQAKELSRFGLLGIMREQVSTLTRVVQQLSPVVEPLVDEVNTVRSICVPRANSALACANRAQRGVIDTQESLNQFQERVLTGHESEVKGIRSELAALRQSMVQNAEAASAEADGLRMETAALRGELKTQADALAQTQSELAAVKRELGNLTTSYVDLRSSHADLRGQHDEMGRVIEAAAVREATLEARIVSLEAGSVRAEEEAVSLRAALDAAGEKHRLLVEESSLFLTDTREHVQNELDSLREESAIALQALRGESKAVKLELEGKLENQAQVPFEVEARFVEECGRIRDALDALTAGQRHCEEEVGRHQSSHAMEVAECRRLVAEETSQRLASERLVASTQAEQATSLTKAIEDNAEAMNALKRVTANESLEMRRMVTDAAREVQMACAEEVEGSMRKAREAHEQLARELHQDVEASRVALMKSSDQVNGNTSQEFWQVHPAELL